MKIAAGTTLVAVVFVVDYLTGSEISFSIFYLIPVVLVAATAGWGGAAFISVLSGIAWLLADFIAGARYSQAWIPVWNMFMRIMIFMLVARLLIRLIAERERAGILSRLLRQCGDLRVSRSSTILPLHAHRRVSYLYKRDFALLTTR